MDQSDQSVSDSPKQPFVALTELAMYVTPDVSTACMLLWELPCIITACFKWCIFNGVTLYRYCLG